MKSINKKIIVTILVIIEIMLINVTYKSYSNRIIDEKEIENKRVAIKVDNGNNEYEDRETLPGRGYVLNTELTECLDIEGKEIENIKLDSNGENITITGRYTSYCTLYYYLPESREYDYIGDYQVFIAPKTGNYKIELWGASGGSTETGAEGGKGAYTKGTIALNKQDKLYIYVGESGEFADKTFKDYYYKPTYNGGGSGLQNIWGFATSGGGATDARLSISETGNWDDFNSLKSRIIVAGGGGGSYWFITSGNLNGGYGGALNGGNGKQGYGNLLSPGEDTRIKADTTGGTQISGGITNDQTTLDSFGKFGKGGNNYATASGGGGGYYGGAGGADQGYSPSSGAGGSSYISGYTGCVAIKEESTEDNVQPKDSCTVDSPNLECSKHYSGKFFIDTQMIAGNSQMPTHNGEDTMEGNTGNGYAKITFVNN